MDEFFHTGFILMYLTNHSSQKKNRTKQLEHLHTANIPILSE